MIITARSQHLRAQGLAAGTGARRPMALRRARDALGPTSTSSSTTTTTTTTTITTTTTTTTTTTNTIIITTTNPLP
eukprot:4971920-Heterocapsa_arctica.AAC.1